MSVDSMVYQIVFWALTTAVTALCMIGWKMGNRVLDQIDDLKEDLNNKFTLLKDEMSRDVGSLRERLARIEGHLWPRKVGDDGSYD